MQTFLPFPDYARSAAVLDDSRLRKQCVEVGQILSAVNAIWVEDRETGWQNHPATRMWVHNGPALAKYGLAMCHEYWKRTNLIHRATLTIRKMYEEHCQIMGLTKPVFVARPWWMGNVALHYSHQANLLRKDPARYGLPFAHVAACEYYWPSGETEGMLAIGQPSKGVRTSWTNHTAKVWLDDPEHKRLQWLIYNGASAFERWRATP